MENSLIFDISLVTKFWDFDYGTFSALPNNCRIKKIIKDEDGEFTIFCTKMKMKYSDDICIEVLNPSFEFDYILTTIDLNGTRLNSAIMLTWPRTRNGIANEAHRIFISLFLYNKIDNVKDRQRIRQHIHKSYNYKVPAIKLIKPFKIPDSENVSLQSTQKASKNENSPKTEAHQIQSPPIPTIFGNTDNSSIIEKAINEKNAPIDTENLIKENVSLSSVIEYCNSFEIIKNENIGTPFNEFSKILESSVQNFNNSLKVNTIGQMPFYTEVQSENDSINDETVAENSDDSENFVL